MSLSALRDALQASAYTQAQKRPWEWLFVTGLPAALLAGTGVTITPDAAAGTLTFSVDGDNRQQVLQYQVGDETTTITTGAGKSRWRLPYRFHLTAVRASLGAASSSGAVTVDVNIEGASVFGTNKLTLDANEKTSTTAATAADFSEATFEDDAEVTIDIDGAGTNAAGLKVYLIGYIQLDDVYLSTEADEPLLTEAGDNLVLES